MAVRILGLISGDDHRSDSFGKTLMGISSKMKAVLFGRSYIFRGIEETNA
jgi:hypothetical protein